ncbi:MAG: glycosyltransferase family 39 protein [Candidatus Binatia bacterium]|nr:glycosyltransferase family 39 protein [Candidatus Binatia bacterium]
MSRPAVRHPGAILAGIVFAALALRAVVLWQRGPSGLWFGDAASYLEVATTLCREGRYPWTSNLPLFRAPGLPGFIAIASGCRPESIAWVKSAIVLLDGGSVVLTYLVARGLRFEARAGLVAAGLVAVHPILVLVSTGVTSEPLATFLISGWLAAMLWGARDARRLRPALWLVAGIAAGLAALTRPAALLCLPLGLVAAVLLGGARAPRMGARAGFLVLGALLTLWPWTLVASEASGGFVLITDGGGHNLWRGMHPELARAVAADPIVARAVAVRFEQETSPRVAAEVASRADTLQGQSAEWRRLALENLRADPALAAGYVVRKARVYWRPWPSRSAVPPWVVLACAVLLVPLLLAGFLGLWQLSRRRPAVSAFLALCLLAPWLAQLPFEAAVRFRLPFNEVILCVLAAGVACSAVNRESDS